MLTSEDLDKINRYRKYFIENNRTQASYWDWITSMGTNITCYEQYLNITNHEDDLNDTIERIRVIIYSIHEPIKFLFFYWTLLIFILHKFNFKKPVMKIILAHFIIRSLGDVADKLGDLFPRYYSNDCTYDKNHNIIEECKCSYYSNTPERHPARWVLTRQIGVAFWFIGEIVADWYPLLRTKAVVKNKSIRVVYATCAIFNLSKIAIIIYHFTLWPTKLYNKDGVYDHDKVDMFYFVYWVIHLMIIYSSMIYDFTVYRVLKKNVFKTAQSNEGFLKKFKTISEYRILISAIVSAVFLPIFSIVILVKFFFYIYKHYHRLDFTFDEIRQSIVNIQYYMIFIDQIFLIFSKEENSPLETSLFSKIGLSPNMNGSVNGNSKLNDNEMIYQHDMKLTNLSNSSNNIFIGLPSPINNENNIFVNHRDLSSSDSINNESNRNFTSSNDQSSLIDNNNDDPYKHQQSNNTLINYELNANYQANNKNFYNTNNL